MNVFNIMDLSRIAEISMSREGVDIVHKSLLNERDYLVTTINSKIYAEPANYITQHIEFINEDGKTESIDKYGGLIGEKKRDVLIDSLEFTLKVLKHMRGDFFKDGVIKDNINRPNFEMYI